MSKKLGSVISAQQFDKETLDAVFQIAQEMEEKAPHNLLSDRTMICLFYEQSTRTRFSFESAMIRLGGQVIGTESAKMFSSKAKGETLEDTIRVTSSYGDVIILRYHKEGGSERASKFSSVPIINAGDGTGQHPTQALLDMYTIKKEFGKLKGLKIAIAGDLANGRTVRSLCYFLAKHFPENEVYFISPPLVKMRDDIKEYLDSKGMKWHEMSSFDKIIADIDVFYQTRVQKERFEDNPEEYEKVVRDAEKLVITKNIVQKMKKKAIIMHPLPRVNEIAYEVDSDPRARYFEQAENGIYIRMALLKMILKGY